MGERGNSLLGRSHSMAQAKMSLAPGYRPSAATRLVINVGGVRYETHKSTLRNIPDTRLSWLTEAQGHNPDFDSASGEYFFDRHPGVFNMILNYYRTGKLHAPTDVCGPLFEEELAFWGIDEKQIEPCCWPSYRAHRDAQETLAEFDSEHSDGSEDDNDEDEEIARRFGIVEEAREEKQGFARWQPKVWHLLEDPNSSPAAKVLAVVSVVFVLLYIAIFVAESHRLFREARDDVNLTQTEGAKLGVRGLQRVTRPVTWLTALEKTCVVYFTLEIAARVAFCPSRLSYVRGVMNWVDLLSILPFYVSVLVVLADPALEDSSGLYVFRASRVLRIFRILRLTRYFSGLKILGHTLKASAKELLLMILVLGIGVLIFASFIYFAEQVDEDSDNNFTSIPIGFWWAVVTMTTLGYGDIYPRTALGYIVGAICALCGLLMLALPVPVIVNNFTLYYSHAQAKLKLPQKKKNVLVGAADALKSTDTAESSIDVTHLRGSVGGAGGGGGGSGNAGRRAGGGGVGGDGGGGDGSQSSMDSGQSVTLPVSKDTRKDSDDSAQNSVDSGFKTASASTNGETTGISVIFTDELCRRVTDSPTHLSPSRLALGRRRCTDKRNSVNLIPNNGTAARSMRNSRRRSLKPSGNMRVDIVEVDV